MDSPHSALLVHKHSLLVEPLEGPLKEIGFATATCEYCRDLPRMLERVRPELVFTEAYLVDGSWLEVVKLVRKASTPANVLVIAMEADSRLNFAVRDSGGYGCLAPPFEWFPFLHVVHMGLKDLTERKQKLAHGNAA